jgi:hypothetical protein
VAGDARKAGLYTDVDGPSAAAAGGAKRDAVFVRRRPPGVQIVPEESRSFYGE